MTRELYVIGIGAGNPEHLTLQAHVIELENKLP